MTEELTVPTSLPKLYIATHANLSSGYQIAQVAHAVTGFIFSYPELARDWHANSNVVVAVEARDTNELDWLIQAATYQNLAVAAFYEPDLGDELTAVAFGPDPLVSDLLKDYPLVGANPKDQELLRAREAAARDGLPQDTLF